MREGGREEGGEREREGADREIKKKRQWHNNCTYPVNIHIIRTVNPKR